MSADGDSCDAGAWAVLLPRTALTSQFHAGPVRLCAPEVKVARTAKHTPAVVGFDVPQGARARA